jgi:cytosine/adenosine deaminase-related metal-dependent hydrolase
MAVVARKLYGRTMVEHIRELGLLKPKFCGAHSVWLTDRDIEVMAETGAGVSHNPISNLYLGSGIARVPELVRRGIAVGIGTDGPLCASNTSLFEVMKLAAVIHRIREADGSRWISARDAFRMATIEGARALGLDQEIGSIEVGKKADLVLLNANTPNFVPLNDPVVQLVYGETGSSVNTVIAHGRVVLDDGRPTRFDSATVLAEADELGPILRKRAKSSLAQVSTLEPYLKEAYLALVKDFEAEVSSAKSHDNP